MKIGRLRRRAHARWFLVKHDVERNKLRQLTAHRYALAQHSTTDGAKRITSHDSVNDALAHADALDGWRPSELLDLNTGKTVVTHFTMEPVVAIAEPTPEPHMEEVMTAPYVWPLVGRLAGNPRTRRRQGPEKGVWFTLLSPCEDGDDLVFSCYAKGAMAANIAQLCRKDTHVVIHGLPRQRRITDDQGQAHVVTSFEIVAIGPSLSHLPVSTAPSKQAQTDDNGEQVGGASSRPRRRLAPEGIKRPAVKSAS